MRGKPKDLMKNKGQMPKRGKNVPRETLCSLQIGPVLSAYLG